MADEENQQEYQLVTEAGDTLKKSYGYTGKGVATYPNGDVYDGSFVGGIRHGDNGMYKYNNKNATEEQSDNYRGQWHENNRHGIGKMTYVGKGVYYGYWESDFRHGEGVMTYTNQDVYSGNWKQGKKHSLIDQFILQKLLLKHGQGTYVFFETGMKFVGKWSNGQIVDGEWRYPNGTKFSGRFDNNKPKGQGKWTFENGNVVEGSYTQTKRADVDTGDDIRLAWKTTSDITKAPTE